MEPLIIKSSEKTAPKNQGKWNEFEGKTNFIPTIDTPEIDKSKEDINKIISGIPTPWARAIIFRFAIEQSNPKEKKKKGTKGIMAFYDQVLIEWRALLAMMALFGEKLVIEKIELAPGIPKGKPNHNPFGLKGGLGGMLFEDNDLWCDFSTPPSEGEDKQLPFLQSIKYRTDKGDTILIGATSPYSLVFYSSPN